MMFIDDPFIRIEEPWMTGSTVVSLVSNCLNLESQISEIRYDNPRSTEMIMYSFFSMNHENVCTVV